MTKNRIIGFLAILVFLLSFFIWQNKIGIEKENEKLLQKINIEQKKYQVEKVIDGDTIVINFEHNKTRVRLIGLNTPEARNFKERKKECFGLEASKKAKEILNNKTITLELDPSQSKYDKYGRLLAYIFVDGINFAKLMISSGYGYEYTYHGQKYKYQKEFKEAQKRAEKKKLGLWAEESCKDFNKNKND